MIDAVSYNTVRFLFYFVCKRLALEYQNGSAFLQWLQFFAFIIITHCKNYLVQRVQKSSPQEVKRKEVSAELFCETKKSQRVAYRICTYKSAANSSAAYSAPVTSKITSFGVHMERPSRSVIVHRECKKKVHALQIIMGK